MSNNLSGFEQLGTVANVAQILSLLGQLIKCMPNSKSDPTKALSKLQKELDSFGMLLIREKNVVTGDTFQEFGKQCVRIDLKIQKEIERFDKSSKSKSEKKASLENTRRISGNLQKVKKDFLTSSANARNIRSTSTIHVNIDDSTTTNTSDGLASIPRGVWEMCTSRAESRELPTHIEPNVPRGEELSQPASGIQVEPGYFLTFIQADGTERLVHSEDLKRDPRIAPELVNVIMRMVEAYQQGAPVAPSYPSAHSVQIECVTGNAGSQGAPIYRINLDRVPEIIDAQETRGDDNV
ncbi:unnamed protein product [Rhizoctonia solani]|uniref:Uncharacterized protein n=1 Tax=Rhizoctonia solani TaxID=456999 RepID=A0A8H3H5Y7_9AGAM|nr:unnamed protein product [Rhizoctonia solani]